MATSPQGFNFALKGSDNHSDLELTNERRYPGKG